MNPKIRSLAFASLLTGIASSACSERVAVPRRAPIPIKVQKVEATPGDSLARYSGVIEPAAQVEMAFRVGGYVEALGQVRDESGTRRPLDKGDFVKKGSVLARIRSVDYAQRVLTSRALIDEARSEAKLAQADLERSARLFESKAITKAEYDARLARAEYAQANVQGALAHEKEASLGLDDTVLRAPMDGVLLSRQVEVGSLVSPGQRAFGVADMRTVKVVFGAPRSRVEQLAIGSTLAVYVESDGEPWGREQRLSAQVTRVAPSADPLGRVFSVEASLPNTDGALRAGTVAAVHVPDRSPLGSSVVVPLSAIVRAPQRDQRFAVYVLEGSEQDAHAPVRLSSVQLGEVLGNSVSVLAGLSSGQRVVTVGSTLLRDGSDAVVIR